MTDSNDPTQNGQHDEEEMPKRTDPQPEFLPSHPGRMVSLAGLVERIVEQFKDEYGSEADLRDVPDTERRIWLRDVAEYIFGVESVMLERQEQAQIIRRAYSAISGYGPLDTLFEDNRVTTIALEGSEKMSVRYAPGTDLIPQEPVFEDVHQMRRMLERLVRDAGAELRDEIPILETGLMIGERPVCVSLVMPPFSHQPVADIRVHPAIIPSLDDLVATDFLTHEVVMFLRALLQTSHGLVIMGEPESGKTTLLAALAQHVSDPASTATVERAGELRLPDGMTRYAVRWSTGDDDPGVTFGGQIQAALDNAPSCLILDEVRADEPTLIQPLLAQDDVPRQIWSFRGASMTKRIRSSLAQLARMSDAAQPEAMVYAIHARLPFVLVTRRTAGSIRLQLIAEWQFPEETGDDLVYPDFVELFRYQEGTLRKTGNQPRLPLDLPDDFWQVES